MGRRQTRGAGTGRGHHRLLTVAVVVAAGVVALGAAVIASRQESTGGSLPGFPGAQPLDTTAFADGSCVAFPPTAGNRGQTVFLDAGHGGLDPGGVGTTQAGTSIDEAQETLPVELDAMAILRADGYRVVVSRTGNSTVLRLGPADVDGTELTLQGAHDDVAARDQCANLAQANLLVGIYFDAGTSADEAGSITAYDTDRPFASANQQFASLLQKDVLAKMNAAGWGIPDDGAQSDDTLGSVSGDPSGGGLAAEAAAYGHLMLLGPADPGFFTDPSQMPGAVIEPLYLTDPFEGSLAASAAGQQTIATGIADAVEQFLAPASSSATTTPLTTGRP